MFASSAQELQTKTESKFKVKQKSYTTNILQGRKAMSLTFNNVRLWNLDTECANNSKIESHTKSNGEMHARNNQEDNFNIIVTKVTLETSKYIMKTV